MNNTIPAMIFGNQAAPEAFSGGLDICAIHPLIFEKPHPGSEQTGNDPSDWFQKWHQQRVDREQV